MKEIKLLVHVAVFCILLKYKCKIYIVVSSFYSSSNVDFYLLRLRNICRIFIMQLQVVTARYLLQELFIVQNNNYRKH